MSDRLHDILGDRYDDVIEKAARAQCPGHDWDTPPESRFNRRALVEIQRAAMRKAAADVLAAVLPELLMEARSQGWIAAVASMRYADGTPVEIVANVNPFRTTTDPEETDHA